MIFLLYELFQLYKNYLNINLIYKQIFYYYFNLKIVIIKFLFMKIYNILYYRYLIIKFFSNLNLI